MTKYAYLFFVFLLVSCIPLKKTPKIENYEIIKAKKFKKGLPIFNGFVFEDPKDANEFYNYVNTKYDLGHDEVETNVPVIIEGKKYYLSFYETDQLTKKLNLIPILIDTATHNSEVDTDLSRFYSSREGTWYILLMVSDDNMQDCLSADYENQERVIEYLEKMKNEYLTTQNYMEAYFRRK
ncbi:hypothetical protein [Mesonia sp. K7]|uniref:hypothetical protein n=1 Tax=Mesonia sp. K7 TaxID=2218606 RepID=UPI0011B6E177|nr:hypothetical protein [Mesonia sp. K7]